MEEVYVYTAAVVTLITFYLLYCRSCKAKLPPGPPTLPVIGNLYQMGGDSHHVFHKMAKKYGGMFSLRLGSLQFIVISDLEIAREVLVSRGHLFADRCASIIGNLITRNQRDVVLGKYSEAWKVHRKISHRALHMFGDGMQMLEDKMLHEVGRLSNYLSSNESEEIDLNEEIDWTIFSFMCQVVFGHTYERDDPELKQLQESFGTMMDLKYITNFMDFLPNLSFITKVYKSSGQKKVEEAVKVRDKIFDEKFKKARISLRMGGGTTNFAEALLKAASELEDDKKGIKQYISHDRLIMSMFDVFVAGSETTASAVKWAILYMIVWPEVQEKVYQEIKEVVGKGSDVPFVCLSHRKSLPYTEAALMETLRLSSVSYHGLWHQTTEDVNLRGYSIPKGLNVIINYYAIHHNEKYFKDPFGFHPERFLEEGHLNKQRCSSYLPFSAGPRSCLGEPLAKAVLFVIVANLIQRFRFSTAPTMPHPDLNGIPGLNLRPKPYMVSVERRG